jgi:hypothetical protein
MAIDQCMVPARCETSSRDLLRSRGGLPRSPIGPGGWWRSSIPPAPVRVRRTRHRRLAGNRYEYAGSCSPRSSTRGTRRVRLLGLSRPGGARSGQESGHRFDLRRECRSSTDPLPRSALAPDLVPVRRERRLHGSRRWTRRDAAPRLGGREVIAGDPAERRHQPLELPGRRHETEVQPLRQRGPLQLRLRGESRGPASGLSNRRRSVRERRSYDAAGRPRLGGERRSEVVRRLRADQTVASLTADGVVGCAEYGATRHPTRSPSRGSSSRASRCGGKPAPGHANGLPPARRDRSPGVRRGPKSAGSRWRTPATRDPQHPVARRDRARSDGRTTQSPAPAGDPGSSTTLSGVSCRSAERGRRLGFDELRVDVAGRTTAVERANGMRQRPPTTRSGGSRRCGLRRRARVGGRLRLRERPAPEHRESVRRRRALLARRRGPGGEGRVPGREVLLSSTTSARGSPELRTLPGALDRSRFRPGSTAR